MSVIKLSEEQLSIIEDSRTQIRNGESFTDDEINKEAEKWILATEEISKHKKIIKNNE